jgi:hypothetical protein
VKLVKAGGVLVTGALLAFGVLTAYPFAWNLLALLWFVHLRREMWLHRTANPAPPPVPVGVVREEMQVKTIGDGAGMLIYPPGHVERYDV